MQAYGGVARGCAALPRAPGGPVVNCVTPLRAAFTSRRARYMRYAPSLVRKSTVHRRQTNRSKRYGRADPATVIRVRIHGGHGGHGGASPRVDRSPGAHRPGARRLLRWRERATLPWGFILSPSATLRVAGLASWVKVEHTTV
jgi:hypothetical protein